MRFPLTLKNFYFRLKTESDKKRFLQTRKSVVYVLGISSYSHESSCALIKDGQIRFFIEEERLNREKHTSQYPREAIEQCLALEGISIQDVDHITFFWNPTNEVFANIYHVVKYFPQTINLFRAFSGGEDLTLFGRLKAMNSVDREIQKQFNLKRPIKVNFIEHHLSHAASAFCVSPFEESAILTIDGRGESATTLFAVGRRNKIEKLQEIRIPHSLGHLYAAVTDYLGFKPFFDEWKVMGMSAYGHDSLIQQFEDVLSLTEKGEFRLNLKYFKFHTQGQLAWISDEFLKRFGPARKDKDTYEQRHFDMAFALQRTVEKAGVHLTNHLSLLTGLENLCMTGGVVLNCLMNKEILKQTPFKNFFIQPIANDAGTSLGSALFHYHQNLNQPRQFRFDSIYLGPEYSNEEIEKVLKSKNLFYKKVANIARETAQHIAEGKIVGWFQGRMESGPRALGNRSITVNPTLATMKEKLNARVKKREFFRPFAPSILEEKVSEYFDMPKNQLSPYMILVGDVRREKRSVIPAVTHADHTARVHTVSRQSNPRYWELISEFEKITGVPVLLNTSFNENEPIVCTPLDAVNCFLRTEFDVLAIGDFLVEKNLPS